MSPSINFSSGPKTPSGAKISSSALSPDQIRRSSAPNLKSRDSLEALSAQESQSFSLGAVVGRIFGAIGRFLDGIISFFFGRSEQERSDARVGEGQKHGSSLELIPLSSPVVKENSPVPPAALSAQDDEWPDVQVGGDENDKISQELARLSPPVVQGESLDPLPGSCFDSSKEGFLDSLLEYAEEQSIPTPPRPPTKEDLQPSITGTSWCRIGEKWCNLDENTRIQINGQWRDPNEKTPNVSVESEAESPLAEHPQIIQGDPLDLPSGSSTVDLDSLGKAPVSPSVSASPRFMVGSLSSLDRASPELQEPDQAPSVAERYVAVPADFATPSRSTRDANPSRQEKDSPLEESLDAKNGIRHRRVNSYSGSFYFSSSSAPKDGQSSPSEQLSSAEKAAISDPEPLSPGSPEHKIENPPSPPRSPKGKEEEEDWVDVVAVKDPSVLPPSSSSSKPRANDADEKQAAILLGLNGDPISESRLKMLLKQLLGKQPDSTEEHQEAWNRLLGHGQLYGCLPLTTFEQGRVVAIAARIEEDFTGPGALEGISGTSTAASLIQAIAPLEEYSTLKIISLIGGAMNPNQADINLLQKGLGYSTDQITPWLHQINQLPEERKIKLFTNLIACLSDLPRLLRSIRFVNVEEKIDKVLKKEFIEIAYEWLFGKDSLKDIPSAQNTLISPLRYYFEANPALFSNPERTLEQLLSVLKGAFNIALEPEQVRKSKKTIEEKQELIAALTPAINEKDPIMYQNKQLMSANEGTGVFMKSRTSQQDKIYKDSEAKYKQAEREKAELEKSLKTAQKELAQADEILQRASLPSHWLSQVAPHITIAIGLVSGFSQERIMQMAPQTRPIFESISQASSSGS